MLPEITVVTVTYGNRWHLLEQVINEVQSQGVKEVIVIDNAAHTPIEPLVKSYSGFVKVFRLKHNSGSAGGFRAGIAHAFERNAEYILLLDDDNIPEPGCISKLLDYHGRCSVDGNKGMTALLAYRSNFLRDCLEDVSFELRQIRFSAFLGFRLKDLPVKILKRFKSRVGILKLPCMVKVELGTYGGLFFNRSLVDLIGLPREDFVLYVDDYEFTSRITLRGGSIWLVTDARINDLELQWNAGNRFRTAFEGWLMGGSDLRAYYTARNRVYFESHLQFQQSWSRMANKFFFLAILGGIAWLSGKRSRFKLLSKAIADGEQGRLGMNPEYPL